MYFLKLRQASSLPSFNLLISPCFSLEWRALEAPRLKALRGERTALSHLPTREIRDRLMQHTNKADLALLWPPKITNLLFSGWPS